MLESQEALGNENTIIFALNLFHNDSGDRHATQNHIDDVRGKLDRYYKKVRPCQSPIIVEIDAKRGTGIQELVRQICLIVPGEKLDNLDRIRRTKIYEAARKRRKQHLRDKIIRIISRVSRRKVNETISGDNLLFLSFRAVVILCILTFVDTKVKEEVLDSAYNELIKGFKADVDQIIRHQQVDIKAVEDVFEMEDILVTEYITEKQYLTELRPSFSAETLGHCQEPDLHDVVIGQHQKVVGQRKVVIGEKEIVVRIDYLEGGYAAVSLLLSVFWALEFYLENHGSIKNLPRAMKSILPNSKAIMNRQLSPQRPEICRLITSQEVDAEARLVFLLEEAMQSA